MDRRTSGRQRSSMSAAAAGRRLLNWRAARARAVSSPDGHLAQVIERAVSFAGIALANIRFEEADAQTFPFPPQSFVSVLSIWDSCSSRSGRRVREPSRGASAGGRLSFVCWPRPRDQFHHIPIAAATGYHPAEQDPEHPAPSIGHPGRVRRILTRRFATSGRGVIEKVGGGRLMNAEPLAEVGPLSAF